MTDQNEAAGRRLVARYLCCRNEERLRWVYLLMGGGGGIKIGKADSYQGVRRQITYAQTYCETGILDVKLIHGGKEMEQSLHKRFNSERLIFEKTTAITSSRDFRSEWFRGPSSHSYFDALCLTHECEYCRNEQLDLYGALCPIHNRRRRKR